MLSKKLWYRSRGLKQMEERFGYNLIKDFIKKQIKTQKTVRILELGFGEGKCLIELKVLFPKIELYGINHKKSPTMNKKFDFYKNSKHFNLSIPKTNLPKPYFYDAGEGLKFRSNFFDLIISQVAFPYVGDKAKLIEEFYRVLKLNGEAFVQLDRTFAENLPDFLHLNKETPLFIIYKNDKMIRLSDYLKRFRKKGFNVKLKNSLVKERQKNLLIIKENNKKLNLDLEFDENSSLYLNSLKKVDDYKDKHPEVWWGSRSVFRTK